MRQRVVIHCPEGAWGEALAEKGQWVPLKLTQDEIIAASVRATRFAQAFYTVAMNRCRLPRVFIWRTPARGPACWRPMRLTARKTLAELQAFIQENGQAVFS